MERPSNSNTAPHTNNDEVLSSSQRNRNQNYYRNWRQNLTQQEVLKHRQTRRLQEQARVRNLDETARNARLERRREGQRQRRTQHAVNISAQPGSSTNTVQISEVIAAPYSGRNVSGRTRLYRCAKLYFLNQKIDRFILQPTIECYCNALLFQRETTSLCCNGGKIRLEPIVVPVEMFYLFADQSPIGRHFRHYIRAYNHIFSFTSMGVHVDEEVRGQGIYTFRAQEAIYHKIGNLLPNANERPRFLQLYIFDTDNEMQNRLNENNTLDNEVIQSIKTILDLYNPFVHTFRHMAQRPDLLECRLKINELPPNRRQYDRPIASEVAAILVGGEKAGTIGARDIVIQAIGGVPTSLLDTTGYYDPLQYPLLLPYGTYDWTPNCSTIDGRHISCCDFYSYTLQIRNNDRSVLLRAGRLLQQYVVDNYVKIEANNLRWVRLNQEKLRRDSYKGVLDAIHAGENHGGNIGQKVILPSSIVGSPRDMYQRYQDAMALILKYGKPDIFLTMTCNPNWKEISEKLLPGQTPNDRPDLLTRIFRAKFEELKYDLFTRNVLGKVKAHVYVIEFQKRGLPHAHLLLILDDDDKLTTPDEYDSVVRAEIPDKTREPELHGIVVKHMIHGPCGDYNNNSPCMKDGKCKRRFPKTFSDDTKMGIDSYPIYRRREGEHIVTRGNREVHLDNS